MHYGRLGPNKSLAIRGGMTHVDLTLKTGEVFYIPRVLIGFYDGSLDVGRNALRRFLDDWGPSWPEGVPHPHVQATPGGYMIDTEKTDQAECRKHAEANAAIGVEYYCIENWFQSLSSRPSTRAGGATGASRGSWFPDKTRFQDLAAFSKYVQSLGMRFGLWTDMEVAHSESIVAREHPEWILYVPDSPWGLLNLSIPDAQDWAIGTYDGMIRDYRSDTFSTTTTSIPMLIGKPMKHRHTTADYSMITSAAGGGCGKKRNVITRKSCSKTVLPEAVELIWELSSARTFMSSAISSAIPMPSDISSPVRIAFSPVVG